MLNRIFSNKYIALAMLIVFIFSLKNFFDYLRLLDYLSGRGPGFIISYIYTNIALILVPTILYAGAIWYVYAGSDLFRFLRYEIKAGIVCIIILMQFFYIPSYYNDISGVLVHRAPNLYLGFMTMFPSKLLILYTLQYSGVDVSSLVAPALVLYTGFTVFLVASYFLARSRSIYIKSLSIIIHGFAGLLALVIGVASINFFARMMVSNSQYFVEGYIFLVQLVLTYVSTIFVNLGLAYQSYVGGRDAETGSA